MGLNQFFLRRGSLDSRGDLQDKLLGTFKQVNGFTFMISQVLLIFHYEGYIPTLDTP